MQLALATSVAQDVFGELVGISQPAVSDLMARGVLKPGAAAGAWLLAYTTHLREQAAGRGADGELARERSRLAREQADRIAMENAQSRKELAPVGVVAIVLGKMAGDVASILNGLVPRIRRRVPDLSGDALRAIDEEVTKARTRAARVSMADLDEHDEDDEDAEATA